MNPICNKTNYTVSGRAVRGKDYSSELLIVNCIISISIIAMNLLVFSVFLLRKKTVLITPSNWLLVSLSFCDLLKGIGVILILVKDENPQLKNPNSTFGFIYRILVDVYNTFIIESIVLHLCGLTLDRHIALFHTYKYDSIVTLKNVSRYILFCWVFSFAASSIQFTWLYDIMAGNHCTWHIKQIASYEIWYSLASFIVFLALPTVLLGIAFSGMFMKIRCIISRLPESNIRRTHSVSSRQIRVLYAFGSMYLCFSVLVMPYFSLRLALDIINWITWREKKPKIDPLVFHITAISKNLTSLINPLLYAGTCPKFQAVFKQIICAGFSCYSRHFRRQTTQKPLVLEMQHFSPNHCKEAGASLLRMNGRGIMYGANNGGDEDNSSNAF